MSKPKRPKPKPKGKVIDMTLDDPVPNVRIDPELQRALRRKCVKERLGPTRVVNRILRERLTQEGLWPEQESEAKKENPE